MPSYWVYIKWEITGADNKSAMQYIHKFKHVAISAVTEFFIKHMLGL